MAWYVKMVIIRMPHPCHSLWQEISQIMVEGMMGGWYDSALLLKEVILFKFQPFCLKLEVWGRGKTGGLPLSLFKQIVSKFLSALKKQRGKNLFVVYSLGSSMTQHWTLTKAHLLS